jgi:hypothetical protein
VKHERDPTFSLEISFIAWALASVLIKKEEDARRNCSRRPNDGHATYKGKAITSYSYIAHTRVRETFSQTPIEQIQVKGLMRVEGQSRENEGALSATLATRTCIMAMDED